MQNINDRKNCMHGVVCEFYDQDECCPCHHYLSPHQVRMCHEPDCKSPATWSYMPGDVDYCDEHVPRGGCSCNFELKDGIDPDSLEATLDENYIEKLDEDGRRLPCCDYMNINYW